MPARDQTLDALTQALGDKYEILQRIGGGGMASVYLARHRTHWGPVAIKVLADNLAQNPAIVERFLQEARTAASLSGHPHIVPIYDVGESQGLHYIVMQYIEGEDLGDRLQRQGQLAPAAALETMKQVSRALGWAHARGVVHRDVKPGNIRLDREGRAVVLDFGIAKARDVSTVQTNVDEQLGTPAYMSPEHLRGETCDGRSDLYSLGIVFFEALAGRRPFTGPTRQAVEQAQVNTPAPSPDTIDPAIPSGYCQVVLRLLEKDPARRYQSAEELLDHLEALGKAASAARPLPAKSRSRWPAVATAAILIAGVAVAIYLRRPAPTAAVTVPPPAERIVLRGGAMRLVPAGSFTFGDASKESPNPLRTAFLPAFYMDETEVSQAAYKQFCDATGRAYPETPSGSQPDYPIVNVTLADAQAFAGWAGKRLPTEEEWEKAARGSDGRTYPWGNTPPARQANLPGAADGFEQVAPVTAFPEGASPYGMLNMAGNVWEWTASRYPASGQEIAEMKSLLPEAAGDWYVIKGGSFAPETTELWLRVYMRRGLPAAGKSPFIGFRCVKDAN